MEYKYAPLEVKATGASGRFEGYGSIFNNVDQGDDVVMPGAFDQSLADFKAGIRKPKMLWQHNPSQPIGVWEEMSADDKGLYLKGRFTEGVALAQEAYALMKDGVLDGLSIGYKTLEAAPFEHQDGEIVRALKKVQLWEVSVVTFPMNTEATVTDVKQLQSPREVEQLLRKAGVPGTFAKLVSLHGFDEAVNRLKSDHREDDAEAQQKKALKELFEAVNGLKEILNA